jgi:hypothetical protein
MPANEKKNSVHKYYSDINAPIAYCQHIAIESEGAIVKIFGIEESIPPDKIANAQSSEDGKESVDVLFYKPQAAAATQIYEIPSILFQFFRLIGTMPNGPSFIQKNFEYQVKMLEDDIGKDAIIRTVKYLADLLKIAPDK